MAFTFTVTPAYTFSTSEKITYPKLNLLGTPVIYLDGQAETSQIADGAITTAKLANPIDINSKIAARNIGLDKLATGTHGQVLYYDSAGLLTTLNHGTDGLFLQTKGPGVSPEWAAQAGLSSVPISLITTAGADKYISTDGSGTIQWEAKSAFQSVAYVWDQKASGTTAGNSDGTLDQTRDLNTTDDPSGIITSLSSNQITLEAGDYRIEAIVPGDGCDQFVSWLYNATAAATLVNGTSCRSYSGDRLPITSTIKGNFSLAVQSKVDIRFRCARTKSDGLGFPSSIAGHDEIYTTATIYKDN